MRTFFYIILTTLLLSCASQPPQPLSPSAACKKQLNTFQQKVKQYQVRDAQYRTIKGHPHLALDRFLSYLSTQLTSAEQRKEWLQRAYQLAEEKREIELSNLPTAISTEQHKQLSQCARQLLEEDQIDAATNSLSFQTERPDNYSLLKRTLGIYPITRLFVSQGVRGWQQTAKNQYPSYNDSEALIWQPQDRIKLSANALEQIMANSKQGSSLNIPTLTDKEQAALFAHYAPIWSMEQATDADRPGKIVFDKNNQIEINSDKPLVYTHLSHTLWHDKQVLLQLNYAIWFPERPKQTSPDIYAGFLDGLIWRVTLDADGQALFYDAIHQCGCYYQVFPAQQGLQAKPTQSGLEPLLILPLPEADTTNQTTTIHLQAANHFIKGIDYRSTSTATVNYQTAPYNQLRSLPSANGKQSLFASNGLVKGTERAERWLLWPMGIISPGAMRQWGNHAIAFVGRRHFDDPDLFTTNFRASKKELQ